MSQVKMVIEKQVETSSENQSSTISDIDITKCTDASLVHTTEKASERELPTINQVNNTVSSVSSKSEDELSAAPNRDADVNSEGKKEFSLDRDWIHVSKEEIGASNSRDSTKIPEENNPPLESKNDVKLTEDDAKEDNNPTCSLVEYKINKILKLSSKRQSKRLTEFSTAPLEIPPDQPSSSTCSTIAEARVYAEDHTDIPSLVDNIEETKEIKTQMSKQADSPFLSHASLAENNNDPSIRNNENSSFVDSDIKDLPPLVPHKADDPKSSYINPLQDPKIIDLYQQPEFGNEQNESDTISYIASEMNPEHVFRHNAMLRFVQEEKLVLPKTNLSSHKSESKKATLMKEEQKTSTQSSNQNESTIKFPVLDSSNTHIIESLLELRNPKYMKPLKSRPIFPIGKKNPLDDKCWICEKDQNHGKLYEPCKCLNPKRLVHLYCLKNKLENRIGNCKACHNRFDVMINTKLQCTRKMDILPLTFLMFFSILLWIMPLLISFAIEDIMSCFTWDATLIIGTIWTIINSVIGYVFTVEKTYKYCKSRWQAIHKSIKELQLRRYTEEVSI